MEQASDVLNIIVEPGCVEVNSIFRNAGALVFYIDCSAKRADCDVMISSGMNEDTITVLIDKDDQTLYAVEGVDKATQVHFRMDGTGWKAIARRGKYTTTVCIYPERDIKPVGYETISRS